MSEGTTARSIRIISELVESGVKLAELDSARREMMRKSAEILSYKGRLLQRVEYASDGRLAIITIPWEEIERYSHEYNPSMLVIDDMRLVDGVDVAIAYKIYNTGAVTAKIRCNYGKSIADKLAEHFGGGGHPYASGFRIAGNRKFEEIKTECSTVAGELLDKLGD
jgi:phosphoesterase RecJ-like protein